MDGEWRRYNESYSKTEGVAHLMTITSTLVDVCLNKLPGLAGAQPLAVARRCLVDSLACAYAGADEEPIQILSETLGTRRGGGEGTGWRTSRRC